MSGVRRLRLCQLGADAVGGKGHAVTKSLQYSFIIAFAYPIARLLAASFADRIERRWVISAAAVAIGGFGLAFAWFTDPALLILCGVMITAANMTMSYAYHAYQTEVFPTAACTGGGAGLFDEPGERDFFRFHRRLCVARNRRNWRVWDRHRGHGRCRDCDGSVRAKCSRQTAGCVTRAVTFGRGFSFALQQVPPPC